MEAVDLERAWHWLTAERASRHFTNTTPNIRLPRLESSLSRSPNNFLITWVRGLAKSHLAGSNNIATLVEHAASL